MVFGQLNGRRIFFYVFSSASLLSVYVRQTLFPFIYKYIFHFGNSHVLVSGNVMLPFSFSTKNYNQQENRRSEWEQKIKNNDTQVVISIPSKYFFMAFWYALSYKSRRKFDKKKVENQIRVDVTHWFFSLFPCTAAVACLFEQNRRMKYEKNK